MSAYSKLSDLIQAGYEKCPSQCFGALYLNDRGGNIESACAMGLAGIGAGIDLQTISIGIVDSLGEALEQRMLYNKVYLPSNVVNLSQEIYLYEAVILLNDQYKKTISEIVEWLRNLGY